jgi:hypothetical protein
LSISERRQSSANICGVNPDFWRNGLRTLPSNFPKKTEKRKRKKNTIYQKNHQEHSEFSEGIIVHI